jgi:hypothetical protein
MYGRMYGGDDHEGRLASCGDQCAELTARVRLALAEREPTPNLTGSPERAFVVVGEIADRAIFRCLQ